MSRLHAHGEAHLVARIGWLRAAVLGANDGIVSTASLIVGVAAAAASKGEVVVAGMAGLVAGAMSMAAGEYVSVSSQADTDAEHAELVGIYIERGLDRALAEQVASQLAVSDRLGTHARDELGISAMTTARPIQAALTSAATFSVGAAMPMLVAVFVPLQINIAVVSAASLLFLALLGAIGARAGGANVGRATIRVAFWGALAMASTAGIGRLVGTAV